MSGDVQYHEWVNEGPALFDIVSENSLRDLGSLIALLSIVILSEYPLLDCSTTLGPGSLTNVEHSAYLPQISEEGNQTP